MNQEPPNLAPENIDALCRKVLVDQRLDAFDNVDIDQILVSPRLSIDRALWIGHHLLRNGRRLAAYRAGQEILRLANAAIASQGTANAS